MLGVDGRTDLVSESQKVTTSLGVPRKPEAGRITPQEVSTVSLGQRESLSLRWARPVAARGLSVGIVWKLVQLEIPAAE